MKLVVDAHVFDEKFQGSRTYVKGLYSALFLLKPDWHFFLVAHDIKNLQAEFGKRENVTYVPLKSKNKYWRLFYELPAIIRELKVDFAHFQYISPLFKSCRYIVTTHDILFEEQRFRKYFPFKYRFVNGLFFKRSVKGADIVVTVSDYSKQKIAEIYKINPERIFVTSNAIEIPSSTIVKNDYIRNNYGCTKYILYVSRIEPRKNHLALLKAYINLRLYEHNYQLVFVGSFDIAYPEMDEFITNHKDQFEKRLYKFRDVSQADLQQFYTNAEFFVYPSLAEGFGIPPLEAAMCHQKVLCSSATAMKEFSFFKYHIDPERQDMFEQAITSLITDDEYDFGRIQKAIAHSYQWPKSAEVLIKAIETNNG